MFKIFCNSVNSCIQRLIPCLAPSRPRSKSAREGSVIRLPIGGGDKRDAGSQRCAGNGWQMGSDDITHVQFGCDGKINERGGSTNSSTRLPTGHGSAARRSFQDEDAWISRTPHIRTRLRDDRYRRLKSRMVPYPIHTNISPPIASNRSSPPLLRKPRPA